MEEIIATSALMYGDIMTERKVIFFVLSNMSFRYVFIACTVSSVVFLLVQDIMYKFVKEF